jgi:hypothetical protein
MNYFMGSLPALTTRSKATRLREFYSTEDLCRYFDFCRDNDYNAYHAMDFLYDITLADFHDGIRDFPRIEHQMLMYNVKNGRLRLEGLEDID